VSSSLQPTTSAPPFPSWETSFPLPELAHSLKEVETPMRIPNEDDAECDKKRREVLREESVLVSGNWK
jgi:hypothetical protein